MGDIQGQMTVETVIDNQVTRDTVRNEETALFSPPPPLPQGGESELRDLFGSEVLSNRDGDLAGRLDEIIPRHFDRIFTRMTNGYIVSSHDAEWHRILTERRAVCETLFRRLGFSLEVSSCSGETVFALVSGKEDAAVNQWDTVRIAMTVCIYMFLRATRQGAENDPVGVSFSRDEFRRWCSGNPTAVSIFASNRNVRAFRKDVVGSGLWYMANSGYISSPDKNGDTITIRIPFLRIYAEMERHLEEIHKVIEEAENPPAPVNDNLKGSLTGTLPEEPEEEDEEDEEDEETEHQGQETFSFKGCGNTEEDNGGHA